MQNNKLYVKDIINYVFAQKQFKKKTEYFKN